MTVFEGMKPMSTRTLAQRLAEGRVPVAEALRYAMSIAESLRRFHEAGAAYGALAPRNVAINSSGVDLLPAQRPSEVTPYTAPEMISGRPAEIASDVFAFGAVLYEMLSGRRAFDGITSGATASAILNTQPAPLGSPAVDRLIAACLVKDPAARTARMQKILMELKLYSVAVRKSEAASAPRRDSGETAGIVQQLEARIAARLEAHDRKVAEVERGANDALQSMRVQLASAQNDLAATKDRSGRVEVEIQAFGERIVARVQQSVDGIAGRITALDHGLTAMGERVGRLEHEVAAKGSGEANTMIAAVTERMARLEEGLETVRKRTTELHDAIAEDMQGFEKALKQQTASIESARTAMTQTDDLVERVVEALESLQSTVLEQSDDRTLAVN